MPGKMRGARPVTEEREALKSVAARGFLGRFGNVWRWPRHWRTRILSWLAIAGAAGLLIWMTLPWLGWQALPAEFGRLEGTITAILTLAFGIAVFLVLRLRLAKRAFVKRAIRNTRDFVPTAAGSIIQDVVGRDQMCWVLKENLRDPKERRPYLLVGSVGAGKTAVIVRLTKLLAENGVVPVPIRLREVGDGTELDFSELARKRFCHDVDETILESWLVTKPIGEDAWRWLRKENRIVVLADGLEEAFATGKQEKDRDNLIRKAIRDAGEQKLPLIIASRPHAPLQSIDAAIVELEPLSEEAALAYVQRQYNPEEEHRLDWVVERGRVTDMPLYLQITKQLYQRRMLQHVVGRTEKGKLDTRSVDRPALRRRLMKTWVDAITAGQIQEEPALTPSEREAAVLQVSALACIGLQQDTVEVPFDELDTDRRPSRSGSRGQTAEAVGSHVVANKLRTQLEELNRDNERNSVPEHFGIDLPLAATWAEQLGLVEAHGDKVRFQHSLMQAYLGSRFMEDLQPEAIGRIVDAATQSTAGPGPELLTALVFLSRRELDAPILRDGQNSQTDQDAKSELEVVAKLRNFAHRLLGEGVNGNGNGSNLRKGEKVLDLYGSALEIDAGHIVRRHRLASSHPGSGTSADADCESFCQHHQLAEGLRESWHKIRSDDTQGLGEAKLELVHRFGEVLHRIGEQWQEDRPHPGEGARRDVSPHLPAYEPLYEIGELDESYRVRVAIAEEIGDGGDAAYVVLYHKLTDPWSKYLKERKRIERRGIVDADNQVNDEREQSKERSMRSHSYRPSSIAVTDRVVEQDHASQQRAELWKVWRNAVLAAHVTPLLLGSVTQREHRNNVERWLNRWCAGVNQNSHDSDHRRLPLSVERSLARGFKAAANRRVRHPASSPEARNILITQAEEMLKCARSWFTQLTLIQALTLWALPDEERETEEETPQWQDRSPGNRVDQWLNLARLGSAGNLHPFVLQAANLAEAALRTRKPERFLWIDETGVVNKVGSATGDSNRRRVHNLWIPPSTGWSALRPETQQLVGDVLLLLNLSERGGTPDERDRYLGYANRPELPPCLDGARRPLDPLLSVAKHGTSRPGSRCVDGCPFELCPYPPRGARDLREIGEAFCRRQATIASSGFRDGWWHPFRRRARWQHTKPRDLRQFWNNMATRTHARTGRDSTARD